MSDNSNIFNILIVSESESDTQLLQQHLDHEKYILTLTHSDAQATALLGILPIDLVLLDISAFSIESSALYLENFLQNCAHSIPIILIISETQAGLKRCFSQGIADIIIQPLYIDVVRVRVANQLRLIKHRQLEDKLNNAQKMAELGDMVAEIIHEVASPLSNLRLSLDYLCEHNKKITHELDNQTLSKNSLQEHFIQSDETLKQCIANISLATSIISSFKQISVDQCANRVLTFNLLHYTRHILLMLRPKLKKYDHQVLLNIDERIEITNYPGALSQIIINFVNNSLSHAFEGIEQGVIEISAAFEKETVCIVYKDDGMGMDQASSKKAFDKYYTTKAGLGGSGLGLHICKDLVTELMQGKLTLSTKLGLGTTFTIELPKEIKES